MNNKLVKLFLAVFLFVFLISFVSAGLGIRKYQESIMVSEGEEGCVTVGAYNPFSTDTNVNIGVADSLKEILTLQEADTKLLPADTSSDEAINMKFCFKVPNVYKRDCAVGGFICSLSCSEPQKSYEGQIYLQTVPLSSAMGGTGGSSTSMAVSQNMIVRVSCEPHSRDYTLVYALIAIISALVVGTILFRKYRKPKEQRIKEKMQKLKEEMKSESKGKKK